MNTVERPHPSRDDLEAFSLGRLALPEQAEIEQHVAQCDRCCEVLRTVADDTLLERLRTGATIAAAPHSSLVTEAFQPAMRASDSGMPLRVPAELMDHPRYRLLRVLGVGGMGVVYQAEHRLMERPVALKVINRQFMNNPSAVQRFRLEVKTAARLNHSAIVTAHDAEQAGELHFLVMEYVDGVSVAHQVARRGALRVDHACKAIRQAALGLQHAHEKGMVHRDIKPQNLMLVRGRNVSVKILDFGLARFASEQGPPHTMAGSGESAGGGLTMTGVTLGTPDYISPEQIVDARRADIRSDIYSLGCTFYFMLAGHPPFVQGSAVDKLISHAKTDPRPIREIRNDCPPEVAAILERMMAKEPANRFPTPGEVAQALAPFCKAGAATLSESPPATSGYAESGLQPLASIPSASADQSGPIDLGEINLSELPELLPPLPQGEDLLSLPARPLVRGSQKPVDRMRSIVRRYRPAIAAAGAVLLVGLLGWMCYPAIRNAMADRQDEASGDQELSSASADPVTGPSYTDAGSPFAGQGGEGDASRGATSGFAGTSPQGASGRVLVVIPHQSFWYGDYGNIAKALELFSMSHDVASSSLAAAEPARDQRPMTRPVTPTVILGNADPADYDAVIFCGGVPSYKMEFLADGDQGPAARRFMTEMLAQGKIVAGICAGNAVLADAGILRGKPAAANQYIPQHIVEGSGALWDDRDVVVADRILTARAESAAKKLVMALRDRLPQ